MKQSASFMNVHYFLLIERLNQMERYLHLVQSTMVKEQERFYTLFKEMEEENEDAIEILYDELVEVRDEFPRMLFASFLVAGTH